MTGIHTATAELYRLFDSFNRRSFKGRLPTPQITIQKADTRSVLGWCTVGKVWLAVPPHSSDPNTTGATLEQRWEINIVAENLARPVHDIAATLLHEMVHLANLTHDIRDCTGYQYHNHHFKQEAERVGLLVTQTPRYGYAITQVSLDLLAWLGTEPLNPEAFSFYRISITKTGKGPRGGNSKMKKWSCGCTNVRCAVTLHAICQQCFTEFKQVP